MVDRTTVRIYEYKGRHNINLKSDFVKDSNFPFKPNEELIARIEGNTIVIERSRKLR